MKQPGHNLTLSLKETRSFEPSSETSKVTSSHERALTIPPLIPTISGGVAIVKPSHTIEEELDDEERFDPIKSISRIRLVRSNVRQVRCPIIPEAI